MGSSSTNLATRPVNRAATSGRKKTASIGSLGMQRLTSFFPYIDPPASLARLRQTIIGSACRGVVIPSLILWHEQDDVTAEFRRQVMDIVRRPVAFKHSLKLCIDFGAALGRQRRKRNGLLPAGKTR